MRLHGMDRDSWRRGRDEGSGGKDDEIGQDIIWMAEVAVIYF